MDNKNISDIIESYLKESLHQADQIEIKRHEIASQFNCVPSQINYVINTRFTPKKGYIVESKRGGSGYIRIMKMTVIDKVDLIDKFLNMIYLRISYKEASEIINYLHDHKVITRREGLMMLSILEKKCLGQMALDIDISRALLLKKMLLQLRYESE